MPQEEFIKEELVAITESLVSEPFKSIDFSGGRIYYDSSCTDFVLEKNVYEYKDGDRVITGCDTYYGFLSVEAAVYFPSRNA